MRQSPKRRTKAPQQGRGTISDQLRRAIEARLDGMTVYAIGKASNTNPSVISRFLTGERSLTLPVVDRLAHVLGLRLVAGPESAVHEDDEGV